MGHHVGNEWTSLYWTEHQNDIIKRVCDLFPSNFAPVAQLPQSPGVALKKSVPEIRRTVEELGFLGINLNPDPSGGYWQDHSLADRSFYPIYEAMCELDIPAMVHVSAACNDCFHTTGSHYLGADTTGFQQLVMSDVFRIFRAEDNHSPRWWIGPLPLGAFSRDSSRSGLRTPGGVGSKTFILIPVCTISEVLTCC